MKLLLCLLSLVSSVGIGLAQVPAAQHVIVVVEENHSYSSVIGNGSMPYLNGLAKSHAYGTQYYADTHPSIGNYFELTTGQILTNNDGFSGKITADNLVRHFNSVGKTWNSYAEGLPKTGYTGGDTGLYFKHHNPFAYFSDVLGSNVALQHLVPFSRFSGDLKSGSLPNFSFVIPNRCNDAHDCSLATADNWLRHNIGPVLSNPQFQKSGLLIIVFDESAKNDLAHGGGHVAMVVAGPTVKHGYASGHFYRHENLLRTVCSALVLYGCPGRGASAAPMLDVFTGHLP